jgi:hypothetical protein
MPADLNQKRKQVKRKTIAKSNPFSDFLLLFHFNISDLIYAIGENEVEMGLFAF